jgi:hypothetical protein
VIHLSTFLFAICLELSRLCLFVVISTSVSISVLICLKRTEASSWISFWFLNCGIILKWYLPGSVCWTYRLTCWRLMESIMVFCSEPYFHFPLNKLCAFPSCWICSNIIFRFLWMPPLRGSPTPRTPDHPLQSPPRDIRNTEVNPSALSLLDGLLLILTVCT